MIFTKHYAFYLFVFGSAHLSFDCLLGISRQYVLKKRDREQEALTVLKKAARRRRELFSLEFRELPSAISCWKIMELT
jgi:hypothetical protein